MSRHTRVKQFVVTGSWSYMSFSSSLVFSAVELLKLTLLDRANYSKTKKNHLSQHGPAAITLIVTALDLWLTEAGLSIFSGDDPSIRKFIDLTISEKFKALQAKVRGQEFAKWDDLNTAIDIRNEIVHHFPRPDERYTPLWFQKFNRTGLLLKHGGAPKVDYSFTQKLSSYRLAYWVFEVVEQTAAHLAAQCEEEYGQVAALHLNFRHYQQLHSPNDLYLFDRQLKASQANRGI